jgi:hypothetical protein
VVCVGGVPWWRALVACVGGCSFYAVCLWCASSVCVGGVCWWCASVDADSVLCICGVRLCVLVSLAEGLGKAAR